MRVKLSEINNAAIIILDAGDFLKIKIDKNANKVFELMRIGEETNRDVTKEIFEEEDNYTIGKIVMEYPYSLGMVIAKILKGNANRKCLGFLKKFDAIILQS